MKKKSFKDNPALQFISAAEESSSEDQNPVRTETAENPPVSYKANSLYVETKTRRLQLVLQPSLYEKVKAKAKAEGLSINEYAHKIFDAATREK